MHRRHLLIAPFSMYEVTRFKIRYFIFDALK